MKLRWKILGSMALMLILSAVLWHSLIDRMMLKGFEEVELEQQQQNVDRIVVAWDQIIEQLLAKSSDWGSWNDMYVFAHDGNQAFIDSNIAASALYYMQVDVVIVADSQGKILLNSALTPSQGAVSALMPNKQGENFLLQRQNQDFLVKRHEDDIYSGLLMDSHGLLLVVTRPILQTDGSGPSRGTLLFGRYITNEVIFKLAENLRTKITMYRMDGREGTVPADVGEAAEKLSSSQQTSIRVANNQLVHGYVLLHDVLGRKALLLRMDSSRDVYQHGLTSLSYLHVFGLGIMGISIVATLILLDALVVRRLTRLASEVAEVEKNPADKQCRVDGKDEVAFLARHINQAFTSLAKTSRDYAFARQQAMEQLELVKVLLKAMPYPVFYTDFGGKLAGVNPAFEALVGMQENQILGRWYEQIWPTQQATEHQQVDQALLRHGGVHSYELDMVDSQKRARRMMFNKAVYYGSNGQALGIVGAVIDITDLKAAQDKLRLLSTATEQSPTSVVITDIQGRIEYVNTRFTQITGYTPAEVLGQNPRVLKSGKMNPEIYAAMWRTLAEGREWHGELLNRTKHGHLFWETVSISPVMNDQGVITHYLAVKEDITHRKEVEAEKEKLLDDLTLTRDHLERQAIELAAKSEQLEEARALAENASRTKSSFLANMSHEIRTPMTAIMGFADLLMHQGVSADKQKEFAGVIHRNCQHLLTVINDILDLSKVEAGKMTLEVVECNLKQIVEDVMAMCSMSARQKNLAFAVEYLAIASPMIKTDPVRLRQILTNLLNNAIKFTQEGGIRLLVRSTLDVASDRTRIQMEVVDTGIGMTREQMQRLFQPFTQADSSTTRRFGGTGLGLAISRRLAEMLGGNLTVQSEINQGSIFTLTIDGGQCPDAQPNHREALPEDPMFKPAEHPQAKEKQNSVLANEILMMPDHPLGSPIDSVFNKEELIEALEKIRILVVDDGADNRLLVGMILRSQQIEIKEAENGAQAVEMVEAAAGENHPFDLVLMDMQMPILDGLGATKQIRLAGHTLPIVAFTAHAMRDAEQEYASAGCNAVETKPIRADHLLATIKRLVAQTRRAA